MKWFDGDKKSETGETEDESGKPVSLVQTSSRDCIRLVNLLIVVED